jgi:hypothetical protein
MKLFTLQPYLAFPEIGLSRTVKRPRNVILHSVIEGDIILASPKYQEPLRYILKGHIPIMCSTLVNELLAELIPQPLKEYRDIEVCIPEGIKRTYINGIKQKRHHIVGRMHPEMTT